MSGPERIWAFYSDIFGAMWTGVKDEGATEYIRADLADPSAIREAALREAAASVQAGYSPWEVQQRILALIDKKGTKA